MKKFLEDLLAKKQAKLNELKERNKTATTVDEVRSIGNEILELQEEIRNVESQIAALPNEEKPAERGLDPMKTLGTYEVAKETKREKDVDPLGTMEYRTAFMNYVQKGTVSDVLKRADNPNVAADLGVLLPSTIIQSIMKEVEKVYGQLYSRVRKTNIKGGVKYPIGAFGATFKRITEQGAPSDRQNGGKVTGYIEFSYNIGEIRLSQTLLANVLSVPVFEAEIAKVIVETYVKAMDLEIMTGVAANNQMEGILTEAAKGTSGRISADNIISFTAAEMADWTKWQEKLFAVIPLSMRSLRPEFVMTAHTYEANIKTLKDQNNRPLYNETFNPVDGNETATFKGRQVVFVEEDILKNFNDAADGEYFGMYWVPEQAYCINTNLEFYVTRYFDQEKNEYVDKALVINDGKVLDPKYIYLLKKSVTA